jgi:hypothetical protein
VTWSDGTGPYASPVDRIRTWVPWAVVAGLALLTAGAAVLSVWTSPSTQATGAGGSSIIIPTVPFTGFGGYNWFGPTSTISARWVVPTIVGQGQVASAATWIGAQNSTTSAFIQIGTYEQQFASVPSHYEAFWSDTALHFEAQPIHGVGAGDEVLATMTKHQAGWIVAISDLTEGWSRPISVSYQGQGPFIQGEWIQEDPPPALDSAADRPYPRTTPVHFTAMKIDGHTPVLAFDDAQVLSGAGGVYLVPTAFSNDGFSLEPARGAARQYLADAASFDSVVAGVDDEVATAPTPLSAVSQRSEVTRLITAFHGFVSDLRQQSWPASVDADITQLVTTNYHLSDDFRQILDEGLKQSPALALRFDRDYVQFHVTVDQTRAALGLPPTQPGPEPQ